MRHGLVWLGLGLVCSAAACGDDGDGANPDAPDIDGPVDADIDSPIDAEIDTPPPTFSGTLSLLEATVLNPGTSGTAFGQGVQISIAFTASDQVPPPLMETAPGTPFGCKAWEYTPAQAAAATIGLDEGRVAMTVTGLTPASLPECTFTAGIGYTCPHTATFSTGGTIAAGPQAGTMTLTDADVTFNANNTTNRYVVIGGAAMAANNGAFPILALAGANTIVYGNPAGTAETLPATATHVNLAGVGPTPMVPDPGFLTDVGTATFALTAGGGNHFTDFSVNTGAGTVGDDFTLANAEAIKLNAIPADGAEFSVACDAAGCPGGSASGSILNIVTTDTSVAGLSPFAMPPPTTKRIQIRCAALQAAAMNGHTITVPAAYMALLQDAGIRRIQATFIRPQLMSSVPVTAVSGHALVGFTNR